MLVFIDESGIHKKTDHSSFVLAYVSVENEVRLNAAIERVEKELKIQYFHWADFGSRRGWETRSKFIERIAEMPFHFKYSIVRNPIAPQESLFNAMVSLLTEKNIKKVIIDGRQPKWYERQIKRSLRSRNFSIKKLKITRDTAEPALRLADSLAGLVRSYHDGKAEKARKLYKFLEDKNKITAQLMVGGQDFR